MPSNDQQLSIEDRKWIEMRWRWLEREFGDSSQRRRTIVLTEPEFFPDEYHFDEASARKYYLRVCDYMEVNPSGVRLKFYSETPDVVVRDRSRSAAGLYVEGNKRLEVWIERSRLGDPLSLVATLAHELGHVRLLGEKRVSHETADHELLTDLLTVYFGLGIFTANSTLRERYWYEGQVSGWSMHKLGYMTMPMHGYAHAMLAMLRGEFNPPWSKYLRTDVLAGFKDAISWFRESPARLLQGGTIDEDFIQDYATEKLQGHSEPAEESDFEDGEGSPTCYYCGAAVQKVDAICQDCKSSIAENSRELRKEQAISDRTQRHFVIVLAIAAFVFLCIFVTSVWRSIFVENP